MKRISPIGPNDRSVIAYSVATPESPVQANGHERLLAAVRFVTTILVLLVGAAVVAKWDKIQRWALGLTADQSLAMSVAVGDTANARRALTDGASLKTRTALGMPVLHLAAETCNSSLVRILIARGADPNSQTDHGWTPLAVVALTTGDRAMICTLLEAGADPNGGDSSVIPLVAASESNHGDAVDLLLKAGADPNRCAIDGRSSLIAAIENPDISERLIRRLIAAGANVRAAGRTGITPLMAATTTGRLDLVALLKEKGA
jgi:uncharacterized protein